MILSDTEIIKSIEQGDIIISPFNRKALGSNSYDVHLSKYIACYKPEILDCKKENLIDEYEIENGILLMPNQLYLASTIEYTETHKHLPFLEGKSSVGRLGIQIHLTAGKGDVGFCGHWTLEIVVAQPIKIYAGMPIGQLIFHEVKGLVENKYNTKNTAKYNNADPKPQASRMFKNF